MLGYSAYQPIANEVPKHRKTTAGAEVIVAIDGCGNQCTTNILRAHEFEHDVQLNLTRDLHLKKIGPFKPFEYTQEEFEVVVNKIMEICEENLPDEER